MARLGHLLAWGAMVAAVPATVAFAPVHPAEALQFEPQVVAIQPVARIAPVAAAAVPSRGSSAGAIAVKAALTRMGDPYVWAAAGPHAFDCSGLVVWAFQQAGVELPHSSQMLATGGQPVSSDRMQPGDVVTYYDDVSHVGIYVGNGKIVHASTYGVPVGLAAVDHAPIYNVRRYR